MLKVEFQFQTPEEATAAIQAVSALTNGTSALAPAPVAPQPAPAPVAPPPVAVAPTPAPAATPPAPAEPAPAVNPTATAPTASAPQSTPTAPPAAAIPVAAAPTFTREQIMTAGAALIDAGKMNELMGLLNTFGVQAVTQLKQDQLGTFATELRKLGAQI